MGLGSTKTLTNIYADTISSDLQELIDQKTVELCISFLTQTPANGANIKSETCASSSESGELTTSMCVLCMLSRPEYFSRVD